MCRLKRHHDPSPYKAETRHFLTSCGDDPAVLVRAISGSSLAEAMREPCGAGLKTPAGRMDFGVLVQITLLKIKGNLS
jgi:hypothetical protein